MNTTITQDPWAEWLLQLHEEDDPETKKITFSIPSFRLSERRSNKH